MINKQQVPVNEVDFDDQSNGILSRVVVGDLRITSAAAVGAAHSFGLLVAAPALLTTAVLAVAAHATCCCSCFCCCS